jgi:ribonuclease J
MAVTTVIPLGGLGEVGLNALALVSGGEVVLIDCGLRFPQADEPGVEYLIPDLSWLREAGVTLTAVFLTHGHDDHVGALSHLLREFPAPVYGSPFTLGLVERRLRDELPAGRKLLRRVSSNDWVEAGPFRAEFLPVTHSIPQACALGVETPGGTVLHTGDFKLDPTPVDGMVTDLEGLARWGSRGVDLLCCDSTNAAVPGRTPSERSLAPSLRRLLKGVEGRAYVTSFASHVHRFRQVIEASREAGRSVSFLGRSVSSVLRVARQHGCLRPAPGDILPEPRLRGLGRREATVVVGGSQGEPGSALSRLAHDLEPHHRLLPGDAVFFSARALPGNEVAVQRLINACLRRGAQVHYEPISEVHVSGHAAAEDLADVLELTRPRHLLPVHGEWRHRAALTRLAQARGMPAERIFLVENGSVLALQEGALRPAGRVKAGSICVDRGESWGADDALRAVRTRLSEEGVAFATVLVAPEGLVVSGPSVELLGAFPAHSTDEQARSAERSLREALARLPSEALLDEALLEAELAAALRRHFRRLSARRPWVRVFVLREGSPGAPVVDSNSRGPLK